MEHPTSPAQGGPQGTGPAQTEGAKATAIGDDINAQHAADAIPGEAAGYAVQGSDAADGSPPADAGPSRDAAVVATEQLAGVSVYGEDGEVVGQVRQVLVDLAEGRVAFIVIELDERAGGGLCALPWLAMNVDPATARLSLAWSADALRQAPTFDAAHRPPLGDADWLERVHLFFDCAPYWVGRDSTQGAKRARSAAVGAQVRQPASR